MLKGSNCHRESGRHGQLHTPRPSHSANLTDLLVTMHTPHLRAHAQTHTNRTLRISHLPFFGIYPHVGPSRIKDNDILQ